MPDQDLADRLGNLTGPSSTTHARLMTERDIEEIIKGVLETKLSGLVKEIIKPNNDFSQYTDQTIKRELAHNLSELDKIPDIVRSLREFSGNKSEYSSWKKSVARVLKIYEGRIGSPKYYGIILAIRNKITGQADAVLESYNTPLDWTAISKCLTSHFADKRDLKTLEYQLYALAQGNNTIVEFYQTVYQQLSLILNQVSNMDVSQETIQSLTTMYREKALDTFVRGLNGNLAQLLAIKEPHDLGHALHLCSLLENQTTRNNQTPKNIYSGKPPTLPPRTHQPFRMVGAKQNFHPHLYHNPKQMQVVAATGKFPFTQTTQPNYYNQANSDQARQLTPYISPTPPPRPQPKAVPMEVDQSIRSRHINYMNKPANNDYSGKRPLSTSNVQNTSKMPRQFHIQTESETTTQQETQKDTTSAEQEYYEMAEHNNIGELQEEFTWQTDTEQQEYIDMSELYFLE